MTSISRTHDASRAAATEDAHIAPLWRLGFRPFYLGASLFASLSMLVWIAQYAGLLAVPLLSGPLGHAHEMLFGFAFAVIAGFVLTAGRNWTGLQTPRGRLLAAIFALWAAGRVLELTPYAFASAIVNAAFPLAVAAGLAVPLIRSRNRRNYFFIAIFAAAAAADLLVHLAASDAVSVPPWLGVRVALDLVAFVIVVMGGRVIPMFTNNGVPGTQARRTVWLERASLASVLAVLAADAAGANGRSLALLLAATALAHALRFALWQPLRTLRVPIVWSLHAGYAWIPIHFALRAAAEAGWLSSALATHALTIGAIGGLTIAMMTRTARGHTGRPLRADPADTTCYALVLAAALVRVFAPLAVPSAYVAWIVVSGLLWSAAYLLYFVSYRPHLVAPRADGKAG
jgi:uncharacterized protein involved in response to NO